MYYFYPNEDGTYLYVKAESEVTIAGSGEAKDVKSGKIKEKAVAFATANYYIHINYISQYNL